MIAVTLALCLPLGQLQRGTVEPSDPALIRMRDRVANLVDGGSSPSISIAVGRAGEILWQESFGWADPEKRVAATPHTPYPIASMTKSMTATAVMSLVEEGRVSLHAPIVQYIGKDAIRIFEGRPEDLTVQRVMTYRAGIPHGWQLYPLEAADGLVPPTSQVCMRDHAIVAFPPDDDGFLYSNYAYGVAEILIEAVSGQSYPEFLSERVFARRWCTNQSA